MDRRTILALALCLLIFALFTAMGQKYAPKPVRHPLTTTLDSAGRITTTLDSTGQNEASLDTASASVLVAAAASTSAGVAAAPERHYVIDTPLYRAEFTNRGARLLGFELKHFAAAYGRSQYAMHPGRRPKHGQEVPEGDRVMLGGEPAFALDLGSGLARRSLAATMFAVAESTDAAGAIRALTFTARDSGGLQLREVWRVRPDTYLLDVAVDMSGIPEHWRLTDYSLIVRSWPLMTEASVQLDQRGLRAVSLVGKDLRRDAATGLVGKVRSPEEGAAHWAGVQSHYFLGLIGCVSGDGRAALRTGESRPFTAAELALLPKDTKPAQPVAIGTLVMPVPASGVVSHRFVAYFGPADYFAIEKLAGSIDLERAVDMGFSWIVPVSKPLLWVFKKLADVVPNYGLVIFLLATLVRLALHPFNLSSMKSMRAMQKLQPEIERIREKFKNDSTAMNTAMMALYKENNVNPAGGCLPMLLQMPLFFGLYAVLYNAIDLRHQPFFGWIHDLSAPDVFMMVGPFPLRLLPVIMTGTALLSQVFAPTDPRQAPTMYMMNIVMLGVFYNLPSGLVFYWTVMNVYTALQQWMAMRHHEGVEVVVPQTGGKARRT